MQDQIIYIVTVVSATLMVVCILLQQKGGGLGSTFGSDTGVYRTKRGAEKFIFFATIVFAIIFTGTILLNLVLK